ncbi:MAG TPA: glutaminyl-peptide cyclotransferase [Nevskia sp.]|jgi:glutamine cyclotransferase|nr:glutaminyl-peptide cyclotransferase [Nevskia sp.]
MRIVALVALLVLALGAAETAYAAPLLSWHLVKEYPHDANSFTEGLVLDGQGRLIESSGGYGKSELTLRELATGRKLKAAALPAGDFGEGTTLVDGRIVVLTWREGHGYVYDTALKPLGHFTFSGEGWGLTWDGKRLIQSDGSAQLYFLDPKTFQTLGHVGVHDGDADVYQINELEYVNGRVFANVWQTDRVAVIDPGTGAVSGWLDLEELQTHFSKPAGWDPADNVLNGIAFDPRSGHLYVTGKRWPKLFEIVVELPAGK